MPIRIQHGPVGTLMNLARSAGEAQGSRESAAHDLAFTQMAMQAQVQNAQIGASIQRNNQAFQLQHAALQRRSRTPTRATAGPTPVTQEFDKALGRATVARGWEQQDQAAQMEQLEQMRGSGQYSEREIESLKLGIMGGQSLTQLLKERTVRPAQTELSFAQQESRRRVLHQQQRDDIEAERKSIYDELDYEGKTRDADWEVRLAAVTKKLQAHDAKYATMGMEQLPDAVSSGLNLQTPQPMPNTKAEAAVGQLYVTSKGVLVRWTGSVMAEVEK